MTEESPLGRAEERVGFHIGRTGTGADAAEFILDQKFADKRLAKAKAFVSVSDFTHPKKTRNKGAYCDICGAPECSGKGTSSRRMLANV